MVPPVHPTSLSMSHRQTLITPFKRILEIADRNHLYLPFQRDSKLRAKYFPGAGSNIGRKKLIDAYLREFGNTNPDEKLLQHATYPWIHGYDASLTHLLHDLRKHEKRAPNALSLERERALQKKFTRTGAEEIAAFWSVYAAADNTYRKSVIDMLARVTPPEAAPSATQPPPTRPSSETETQPGYALLGALIFFVPTLLFAIIQYYRLPHESHYIALSIAGFFGLITLIFLINYLKKRNP